MKKYIKLNTLLLFAVLLFTACVVDNETETPVAKSLEVTFSIKIPGNSTPSARTLSEADEYKVTEAEVLVFNNTDGTFLYRGNVLNTLKQPDNTTLKFMVTLKKITDVERYDFVILANAGNIISAAYPSGIPEDGTLTKSDIQAALKLAVITGTGWIADNANASYKHIPMWGELKNQAILTTPYQASLTRMVAKIDLAVALSGAPVGSSFQLEEAWLYNYNTQGYLIPAPANWGAPAAADVPEGDDLHERALAPTVTGLTLNALNPINYTAMISDDKSGLANNIYVFETATGSLTDYTKNTCLVIKATWTPATGQTAKTGWYRLNLGLPLRRNHRYLMNITEVSGVGFASREEAYKAKPVNTVSEVTVLDEESMGNIVFDGHFYLRTSKEEMVFFKEARTNEQADNVLYVNTNYLTTAADAQTGWYIEKIVDAANESVTASWLTATPNRGSTDSKVKVVLTFAANTGSEPRSAIIVFAAGRLRCPVKVTQTVDSDFFLEIRNASDTKDISELYFETGVGLSIASQQMLLKWSPPSATISITKRTEGGNDFIYGTGDTPGEGTMVTINDATGNKTLAIAPAKFSDEDLAINPFMGKIAKVDFTITNGTKTIIKTLYLRQQNYALVVEGLKDWYKFDGSTHSFTAKCNAGWRIKSITEVQRNNTTGELLTAKSENMCEGAVGGNDITIGEQFSFTLSDNAYAVDGKTIITFESTDTPKRFADVDVILNDEYAPKPHKGWAGSNIYYDAEKGHLTFDDVNDHTHCYYQGVFFKYGSLWGISPRGTHYSGSTLIYPQNGGSTTAANAGFSSYESILEFQRNINCMFYEKERAYLYAKHDINATNEGMGDICMWLTEKGYAPAGKKWRIPTRQEALNNSFVTVPGSMEGGSMADGTAIIKKGVILDEAEEKPFLPLTGFRHGPNQSQGITAGEKETEGISGYLIMQTDNNTSSSMIQIISYNFTRFSTLNTFSHAAAPVRCVVHDD